MNDANISKARRKAIYRRDGWRCALCDNTRYIQVHHVIPRSFGGGSSEMNLITLCSVCHGQAHGINMYDDPTFDAEWAELECVRYLSDMYAPDWNPFS